MKTSYRNPEAEGTSEINLDVLGQEFYEKSVEWVLDLKTRHDPNNSISIIPFENFDLSTFDTGIVLAHQPPAELSGPEDRALAQANILSLFRHMGGQEIGEDNFRSLTDKFKEESTEVWQLLNQGVDIADVIYHQKLMALPIVVAAETEAFAETQADFDLFDYASQRVVMVNPALSVALFRGHDLFEFLSFESHIIKMPPPTKGSRIYSDELRKYLTDKAKDAFDELHATLKATGKGTQLYLDPTGSTGSVEEVDGVITKVQRKRVNPAAARKVRTDFNHVRPSAMFWSRDPKAAKSYVGHLRKVSEPEDWNSLIDELDAQTAQLAGVSELEVTDSR